MMPCPSFPGYFVTNDGRVISRRRRRTDLVLRQQVTKKGYRYVAAVDSGKCRPVQVHVLMADAFLGPRPSPTHQVRHLDGNPANNAPENLAWGTAADNAADRLRHGRYASGTKHPNAKLSAADVQKILKLRRTNGLRVKSLARMFDVSVSTIESVIYRKTYRVERKAVAA